MVTKKIVDSDIQIPRTEWKTRCEYEFSSDGKKNKGILNFLLFFLFFFFKLAYNIYCMV